MDKAMVKKFVEVIEQTSSVALLKSVDKVAGITFTDFMEVLEQLSKE